MYLKRLEIFGFKSFAEKTTITFDQGITAVVGPNGCGKSNIFDSIRWVLGEQSVKELRGSAMEDVIFNGTDKKPALGFAEVSLTFSNENRAFPLEYDEVTVSRRLFRSGESEYLINKSVVRLKDVMELIMGTGIGAEAYSLVQQGKVDLVVSARPEDRRLIFDEAAGITKYKFKKREALNKLKETEDNLLRVNDIIVEVKRQIGSIERQAKKAQRYKEEFEQLKNLEILLAGHQLKQFADQQEAIVRQEQELMAKEADLTRQLQEFNATLDDQTGLLQDLEEQVNALKAQEMRLENDIEINNRQIGFNTERIENLTEQEVRLQEQKRQLLEKSAGQEQKVAEFEQAISALRGSLAAAQQQLKEKKDALNTILQTIDNAKAAVKTLEQKIFDLTSRQVQIRNGLTDIMKDMQGCLARKTRLEDERIKLGAEKQLFDQKLQGITQDISRSEEAMQQLKAELAGQEQTLEGQKSQLADFDQAITDLEKKKLFLISQKEFIEKLQLQYEGMPAPMVEGRFLSPCRPAEKQTGLIAKIKQLIAVDPQRAQTLGLSTPELFEIVCEAKFIEMDPVAMGEQIDGIDLKLHEQIQLKQQLLAQIDGQQRTIADTLKKIQDQEKIYTVFESQKTNTIDSSRKVDGELEMAAIEYKEVEDLLGTLGQRERDLGGQLDAVNQELRGCQDGITTQQNVMTAQAISREEVVVQITQMETELGMVQDKERSLQESLRVYEDALRADRAVIQRADQEMAEFQQRKDSIHQEIESLNVRIVELKAQKDTLRGSFAEQEALKAEVTQRLNSFRAQIHANEDQVIGIKTELHQQQMKVQELTFAQRSLKDRLMQTYRINLDEPPAATGEEGTVQPAEAVQPTEINVEEITTQIEHFRRRCEGYGAVNLVAIEEFEQLKERFEFLTKQQSDLLTAREQLHQTITKINRTTRQMFTDTFTQVAEAFRTYYRMLFGGGEAQLVLLDPENPLESGIDIIARPPGKKLQNITLLSGGEKTMTAIALIFGVFKVKPSPFCVLDEIDAALDEANVERYALLLKEFAKIAQFIVITHNKKTIVNADVMYGITMQETGVSKIVSVRLSEKAATQAPKEEAEQAVAVSAA